MRTSVKKGFSFGLTSSVLTTLGLIIGLYVATHSKSVVIAGIIIISLADAISSSFGIRVSEAYEAKRPFWEVWESTISILLSKFVFSISFIIPILFFTLSTSVVISVIWGLLLTCLFSYFMSKKQKRKPAKLIIEHLIVAIIIIVITYYLGKFTTNFFS